MRVPVLGTWEMLNARGARLERGQVPGSASTTLPRDSILLAQDRPLQVTKLKADGMVCRAT